jgi:hypothetical protein
LEIRNYVSWGENHLGNSDPALNPCRFQRPVAQYLPNDGQSRASAQVLSHVNLFRYCQRIVNLDAKIPDGALDLAMAE